MANYLITAVRFEAKQPHRVERVRLRELVNGIASLGHEHEAPVTEVVSLMLLGDRVQLLIDTCVGPTVGPPVELVQDEHGNMGIQVPDPRRPVGDALAKLPRF